jgi:plastocyanin
MRNRTRLILISALLVLPLAAPAGTSAATATVRVGDDFFNPEVVRVAPGDSVDWVWEGANQHTVTTYKDQTENFDSGIRTSGTYSRTFSRRGRFRYFCEIHPVTMRGAVEVGSPPFPDTSLPTLGRARVVGSPGSARFTFRLSEAATLTISVTGPTRKRSRKRLGRGKRSVTLRGLRPGRYRATVRATDRAGNKGTPSKGRFTVPR